MVVRLLDQTVVGLDRPDKARPIGSLAAPQAVERMGPVNRNVTVIPRQEWTTRRQCPASGTDLPVRRCLDTPQSPGGTAVQGPR